MDNVISVFMFDNADISYIAVFWVTQSTVVSNGFHRW